MEPVGRPAPPKRKKPEPTATTVLGMPAVSATASLSTQPYSRVVADKRLVAPSLSDREAAAKEMIKLCEKALVTEKENVRRARLHTEIARQSEIVLGDVETALRNFQKAHQLDASFEPAIAGLLRIRARQGQWEGTLQLYDQQVDLTAAPEDKAALLFTKAVILEMRLDRPQEARADYEKALALVPNHVALLSAVARCARRDQDFKALDQLLGGLATLRGQDLSFSAAFMAERARVAEQNRKNPADAAQYYRKALETDPMATAAILALERLHGAQKHPREQVALLTQRANLVEDSSSRAAALATAGALLSESLGEPAEAAQMYEMAWAAEPGNLSYLETLEELYRQSGNWEGVVQVLSRLADRSSDDSERIDLCLRIAEVLRRRLDREQDAVAYWERAREIAPGRVDCTEPLIAHYEKNAAWGELVQVLSEEESTSADSGRRADLHCRIARICEGALSSPNDALEHYRAALGLRPDDEGAFRELTRLLESARRYEELIEVYQRAVEGAMDDAVAIVHLFKIGQVMEDLLAAPGRAVVVYRQILKKQPGHLGALYSLQRAAERAGEHSILVDALVEEADVHNTAAQKVPLLHRAAQICQEMLSQDQRALALYNQVLTVDAQYEPTLAALVSLHDEAGRYPELMKTLTLQLNRLKEPGAKAMHLHRMGRITEEHLRQDEKALSYYKKALEADPSYGAAARALERCLARLGHFEELATYLQDRIKKVPDKKQRAEIAMRLGGVHELRLGRLQNALGAYEAALAEVPDLVSAQEARIRVLEQRSDAQKTAAALEERTERTADPAVRLWGRLRRAEILENTSKHPEDAIAAYEAVLSEAPRQAEALAALARLYERKGDDDALIRVLRMMATTLSHHESQAGVLRDLLRLSEKKLDALEVEEGATRTAALPEVCGALLDRAPGDRSALRFAELTAIAQDNREQLAAVDGYYAKMTQQPQLASSHRTRLGEFLEPRNPVQALEQHRPALAVDPGNIGAARGITRIAEVIDEAGLLLEAAELETTVVRNPERAAHLFVRAAEVLAAGGKNEKAVVSLKRALTVYPDSGEAARTLHDLLYVRSEFEELCSVLSTAAQAATTSEARAEHWIAVAKIYADELDDLPAAIAALKRLDKEGVKNLPATLEHGELLVRDRQWKAAVAKLTQALTLGAEGKVLESIHLRLAEIYHEHLDQLTDATRELRAVLATDPKHITALRRLLSIQMKEKSPAAVETAQSLSDVSTGPERAEALIASGKLLAAAKKGAEALQPLASAVALIGLDPPDAAATMRKILEEQKGEPSSWAGYVKALLTYCQDSAPSEGQARAYIELGQVLADRQKDRKGAITVLEQGLAKNSRSNALRQELVARLKQSHQFEKALPELLRLLEAEPLNGDSWHDLVEVYDGLGRNASAHMATGPLVLLGKGSALQKSTWKSRTPRPAMLSEGAFGPNMLANSLVHGVSLDAVAMLQQLGSLISKVFPNSPEAFGASSRARVPARGNHPCRGVLDRLIYCMHAPEIDLYPSDADGQIRVVLTDPIGIVIPRAVTDFSETEQALFLGSFVANIARGTHALDALSERELGLSLGAAARIVSPHAEVPGVDESELGSATRKLNKALPWLSKGRFEDAARRYVSAPVVDLTAFQREMRMSAYRASMIVADDVAPLVKLEKGANELLGIPREEVTPLIADLFLFWASEAAMDVRRQVGLV